MSRRLRALLLVLAATGCVRTAPPPPVRDYRLDYAPPRVEAAPLPVVLRLAPFGAAAVYDREAIIYRERPYATGTYLYHRWTARPAGMVTDLLGRDFAASGVYGAVQQGLAISDYDLHGTLEEIEERIDDGSRSAHLRLRVTLERARGAGATPVVFQRTYEEEEPNPSNRPVDLAAAMSRALERISGRLQRDVHDAIATERATAKPPPR